MSESRWLLKWREHNTLLLQVVLFVCFTAVVMSVIYFLVVSKPLHTMLHQSSQYKRLLNIYREHYRRYRNFQLIEQEKLVFKNHITSESVWNYLWFSLKKKKLQAISITPQAVKGHSQAVDLKVEGKYQYFLSFLHDLSPQILVVSFALKSNALSRLNIELQLKVFY